MPQGGPNGVDYGWVAERQDDSHTALSAPEQIMTRMRVILCRWPPADSGWATREALESGIE